MDAISSLFNLIIYQPLYNIIIIMYNIVPGHDFGIAIILTTILLKVIMIPLSKKQIETQKRLQEMQPKIKEIQNKHKDDKEKQTKELMEFYKKNKTNPFSGCLPMIVQLIFLISIYRIIMNISKAGLNVQEDMLYPFVSNPGQINQYFLGFVDLLKPSPVLAVLTAVAQYFQTKMTMSTQVTQNNANSKQSGTDFSQIMNKQMLYMGPLLTLFIGFKFASGLTLYWLTSTLFMIAQQYYLTKNKKLNDK
jgi:YidC/Oxa1 family membrane protein insertase